MQCTFPFTSSTLPPAAALALVSYGLTSSGGNFLDSCWRWSLIMVPCNMSLTSVRPSRTIFLWLTRRSIQKWQALNWLAGLKSRMTHGAWTGSQKWESSFNGFEMAILGVQDEYLRSPTEPSGVKEGRRKDAYLREWPGKSNQSYDWVPGWWYGWDMCESIRSQTL